MKKYLYFRIPLFVRILSAFVLGIGFGYFLYLNSDAKWWDTTINIISPFGNVAGDNVCNYIIAKRNNMFD